MKAIELTKFKPNKRSIARDMWGSVGGSIKTTSPRKASYYHCSSHGGFVCNPKDFTQRQRKVMGEPNYQLNLAIATDKHGTEYVVGVDYPYSPSRSFKVSCAYAFKEWRTYPMYVFEEDCNWAILTYATGIDLVERVNRVSAEERNSWVVETLESYNPVVLVR